MRNRRRKRKTQNDNPAWVTLLFIVLCFSVGFAAFYSYFSYKEIKATELKQIKGTFNKLYLTGSRSKDMIIKLKEYPQEFRISSIQLNRLNKNELNQEIPNVDEIYLSISKEDYEEYIKNSDNSKKIRIYTISSKDKDYITLSQFNEAKKMDVKIGLVIGSVLTILGVGTLIYFIKVVRVRKLK